jgi:copper homeostasis protein
MAGSGLTPLNLPAFLEKVNVREVHFGSGIRHESTYSNPIDPIQIKAIRKIVSEQNCKKKAACINVRGAKH